MDWDIELDFELEGAQAGHLRVRRQTDDSAYGWLMVPLLQVKRGSGPVVLLLAGVHGDEYEGQIVARDLFRCSDDTLRNGTVLIVPTCNPIAMRAGARHSPVDGENLNRMFGGPPASATASIAQAVVQGLLPKCAAVIDVHSGGRSLKYLDCTLIGDYLDEDRRRRTRELAREFGARYTLILPGDPVAAESVIGAAHRVGAVHLGIELAGGGQFEPRTFADSLAGLRRCLVSLGMTFLPGVYSRPAQETEFLRIDGKGHFIYAHRSGLYKPVVALGAQVSEGQVVAEVYDTEAPELPATPVHARRSGIVLAQRSILKVCPGDCVLHSASPEESPLH